MANGTKAYDIAPTSETAYNCDTMSERTPAKDPGQTVSAGAVSAPDAARCGASTKKSKKRKVRRGGLMLAAIPVAFVLFALVVNWGIWRSRSRDLTGRDLLLEPVYSSPTPKAAFVDAGAFVHVWKLPDSAPLLLSPPAWEPAKYPMSGGLVFDGYKLIRWKRDFGSDAIEKQLLARFSAEDGDPLLSLPENCVYTVNSANEANALARAVLKHPDTYCACWYRCAEGPGDVVVVTHYSFYILNPKLRLLFLFGLDT